MAKIESERELSSQIGIHVTSDAGHTLSDDWGQKGAEFLLDVVANQQ